MQPWGRGWLQQVYGHHKNNERQTETQADEVRDWSGIYTGRHGGDALSLHLIWEQFQKHLENSSQ